MCICMFICAFGYTLAMNHNVQTCAEWCQGTHTHLNNSDKLQGPTEHTQYMCIFYEHLLQLQENRIFTISQFTLQ